MRLNWVMSELRRLGSRLTANQIAAFLAVAEKPGLGPTEYAMGLGLLQPTASRLLLDVGPKQRNGAGYHLVDRQGDPESLRQIRYYLTPEGHELAEKLASIVNRGGLTVASG